MLRRTKHKSAKIKRLMIWICLGIFRIKASANFYKYYFCDFVINDLRYFDFMIYEFNTELTDNINLAIANFHFRLNDSFLIDAMN